MVEVACVVGHVEQVGHTVVAHLLLRDNLLGHLRDVLVDESAALQLDVAAVARQLMLEGLLVAYVLIVIEGS